jgi:hypothetical protein
MYVEWPNPIRELCIKNIELSKSNIFIPHIGETFIDKKRNVEYEVKDIVRTYHSDNEYGVQVMLKKRANRKYIEN